MKYFMCACLTLALASSVVFAKGQPEPGDVKGEGKGHPIMMAKGEPEPGDVKGEGKGHPIVMAREAEPKDDRRGKGQPEPGDDRGRGKGHA